MGNEIKFSWETNDNKPKEWICPHCKKVNSDTRILCGECGNLRPSEILQNTSILEKTTVEDDIQVENEVQIEEVRIEDEVEETIQEEDGFNIVYTVLVENKGTELVQTIKAIKDANGKGLKEVKDMLYDLPAVVLHTENEELASNLCKELKELGCIVKIQTIKEEKIEEEIEEEKSEKSSCNKNEHMIPVDIHSSSYSADAIAEFPLIIMAVVLLAMLVGFMLLGINIVKDAEGKNISSDYAYTYAEETITGFSWERCITVEEFSVVKESGNKLPENAKLLYEEQKIENPEKEVLFEVGIEEDKLASIYKELPRETIYHYEIEKWEIISYNETSGTDKSPYWAEPVVDDEQKTNQFYEQYFIHMVDEDGEEFIYSCDEDVWNMYEVGDKLIYEVDPIWGITIGNPKLVKQNEE